MKTCVQIGLWKSAELLFLANKNYSRAVCGFPHQLCNDMPDLEFTDEELESEWSYFGVDSDPGSITYLSYRFVTHPNVHWVNAKIIHGGEVKLVQGNINWSEDWAVDRAFVCGVSLGKLFEHLGIIYCDLLVMDIEGAEIEVFENYDWNLKPNKIFVELHRLPDGDRDEFSRIRDAIVPAGYNLNTVYDNDDWAKLHLLFEIV